MAEKADEKKEPEAIDFTDGKGKTDTVTATKNIPMRMLVEEKKMPAHLRRHPGGARIERGTKITVSEKGAKFLKENKYAK